MVYKQPRQWIKWLSLAEWWYNTTLHTDIKMTPFEALYGIKPPQLPLVPYQQISNTSMKEMLQERHEMDRILKENLAQASARMKFYTNKNRSEREFQIGDWVFLKLHSYAQQTMARRTNKKLSAKYYGPYRVIQRLGKLAYKLELPSAAQIHLVFHVSLLKKKRGRRKLHPSHCQLFSLGDKFFQRGRML